MSTLTTIVSDARRVDVDHGIVLHPEELAPEVAVPRLWRVSPLRHKLSYGLGVREEAEIVVAYALYKDSVRAVRKGNGYLHHAPPQCRGDLRCVYDDLVTNNADAIRPIAERLLFHAREKQLSALELARLIVSYVQSIEYRMVDEDAYGLVPPAILVNSSGDCDSKALLAIVLLKSAGIDAAMLVSNTAQHAMVGVGLPMGKDRLRHRGRDYAVVEVTQSDWPIGRMPPKWTSFRDWYVVPLRLDVS
jgi:hypothetical protein